ncbi:uncharacterized protein LOC110449917 isoform X1 [Mizuhopecten yessoensis]|uniref:uncharacterized protein LOC110449917 isoform X1 n=1 Tax=Mizuhopecten yessoensis TaxID=6573 RepID=UPI000B45F083|nr:uncharacterized protein LOC110449917 isoform X1 [Mizuhopecten yessoensis]
MFDVLWNRAKSLNANNVIFVVLCCIIGYLFRANDSYILKPVWRKRVETQAYANAAFPTRRDRVPPPVITDLEGDGVNEILLISSDFKLSSLALPNVTQTDEDDQTLPHVIVKHKVALSLADESNRWKSRPVVMETGFTVPYLSLMQIRKQIIVIVTDDWHVLCYDSDLQLLWKKKLMDISHVKDTYIVKDMGVIITPHKVRKDDHGLVIIGGSFTHKTHGKIVTHNETDNETEHTTEDNTLTHFSSFALNGIDGTLRWHHLPGDFGEPVADVKDIHGDHHWKLALKRRRLHVGESPWNLYRDELLSFLPFGWQSIDDTKLTLGHFQKKGDILPDSPDGERSRLALTPEHVMGYSYGGHRPHSDHEHVANPNAVIIHNHNGLEVLNLLTGRPITEFPLPPDGSLYVDIDNDGNHEKLVWGQAAGVRPCHIEIWRLQPVKEKVNQLPVCRLTRVFFTTSWVYDEDSLQKVPPVIIDSIAKKAGIFRFLLGHHLPTGKKEYDIITTGGMARVSSFDKEGNVNWQVQTSYRWAEAATEIRTAQQSNPSQYKEFTKSFRPSTILTSIQVSDKRNVLVLAAYKGLSLVDLVGGRLLAEHSLPCLPTAPTVAGDFDNDGLTDFIVTCKMGYLGFTLHHHTNHTYTILYAIAVFFTILLLSWFCTPENYYDEEDDDHLELPNDD